MILNVRLANPSSFTKMQIRKALLKSFINRCKYHIVKI